jgi:DNA-binding SARP family transcriptional activator/tetratricopeptide (TPR) repeat protein
VRLGVLGPLLVADDTGAQIQVPTGRQRVLLAALLVRANQVVPATELAELVWDGAPPAGAGVTVRSYVMRLRRSVGPQVAARIITRDPGYLCQVTDDEVDLLRFETLCRQGGNAMRAHSWKQAADVLDEALGLWRAAPLGDVASQMLHNEVLPWVQQTRLEAVERRAGALLHLGRHDELVPELRVLAAEHPLRERLHAQLMLALYRCGRRAEALDAYQGARRVLVGELGVEPGPQLRELHRQILAEDPALTAPPPPGDDATAGTGDRVTPRQLPAGIPHFTGRASALETLTRLAGQAAGARGAVVISAIGGTAGIGKTALAVHWGLHAADQFPDGQLYVNLRGFDPAGTPLEAAAAVRGFLDALGVPPAHIPAGLGAQAALYRSLLAGRRVLIVLDNARDPQQVRPLLPGSAGCLVLVTSRSQLTGLIASEGAHPLTLDLLTTGEARELLARRLGAERLADEPEAADEIVGLCARLPLALNITAARAAAHPGFSLAALADHLRDASGRLAVLDTGDAATNVRAVFSWSYRTLSTPAALTFRYLGVHPGPDITVPATASLIATTREQARDTLNELVRAQLITEHAPGRYACHDLLRAYAAEQAASHDSDTSRRAALGRMLDHYLHSACAASLLLHSPQQPYRAPITLGAPLPGVWPEKLTGRPQALEWFRAERQVLLAAIGQAASGGFSTHAWQLPWALATFLDWQGYWHELAATQQSALAAAQCLGDRAGQAQAHRFLGRAHVRLGAYGDAATHLAKTIDLGRQLGDSALQAKAHLGLTQAFERQHRSRDALGHAEHALRLYRAAGDRLGEAGALNAVGWYHAQLGDYQEALGYCEQALALFRELENPPGQASTLDSLGYAHHHLGQHAQAISCYQQAIDAHGDAGDLRDLAGALIHFGDAHQAAANPDAARRAWQQALAILDDLHHPDADPVRSRLSRSTQSARQVLPKTAGPSGHEQAAPRPAAAS